MQEHQKLPLQPKTQKSNWDTPTDTASHATPISIQKMGEEEETAQAQPMVQRAEEEESA